MKKTAGQAERKEREEMKQVKSYTSIWNVEKVIHAVGDVNLSKKSFDGKNPYRFLCAAFNYLIRPKETYAGKRVVYRKKTVNEYITAVRRDIYVPD